MRAVLLSGDGQRALGSLLGTSVAPAPGTPAHLLASLLIDRGIVLPPALPPGGLAEVTVVVPARASTEAVLRLLVALPAGVPVVVVDDGSQPRLAIGPRAGLTVVRHAVALGPAAARNAGAQRAATRFVAFIDVDITPPPGCLEALAGYLQAGYAAAAPRIVSDSGGVVERYAGGLDLGVEAATVRPDGRVAYVASALLMVASVALAAVGGFDEELRVAEDVDLVWRLTAGGPVAYAPHVLVRHAARSSARTLLRRSFYGTGAAALARRHPGSVRHADVTVTGLLPWLAALLLDPLAGVALAAAMLPGNVGRIPGLPVPDALVLAAYAQLRAATSLGRWLLRPMWPLTAAAASLLPRRRAAILLALALGLSDVVAEAWRGDPDLRREAHSVRVTAAVMVARVLADAAYSVGVWRGCLRTGVFSPLLPRLRWPAVAQPRGLRAGVGR